MTRRALVADGALVDPASLVAGVDDPGLRWGEGLFEAMRAEDGRVALLDRHLARLAASAATLGLGRGPEPAGASAAVAVAIAACGARCQRVRMTWTPRPALWVEAVALDPPTAPVAVATLRGAWLPGNPLAEHKTLSYAGHRWAERRVAGRGGEQALLLDEAGRLGEATRANVLVVAGDRVLTAPVRGLLPGVARAVVLEAAADAGLDVEVRAAEEDEWRRADEMMLTSGVRGVAAVARCDGRAPAGGAPGPVTRHVQELWRRIVGWKAE